MKDDKEDNEYGTKVIIRQSDSTFALLAHNLLLVFPCLLVSLNGFKFTLPFV